MERYVGSNQLMFSQLTSTVLNLWIEQLSKTNRAKEMYPTCVRQIYKKAIMELNDEERGMIRIKFNPWNKIQIPKSDSTVQRAISAEACREFFNRPLPQSKMISSLPELGRDVALLSLCLGGINTVDMYELKRRITKMVSLAIREPKPSIAVGMKPTSKCELNHSSNLLLTSTCQMKRMNTCSISINGTATPIVLTQM